MESASERLPILHELNITLRLPLSISNSIQ